LELNPDVESKNNYGMWSEENSFTSCAMFFRAGEERISSLTNCLQCAERRSLGLWCLISAGHSVLLAAVLGALQRP